MFEKVKEARERLQAAFRRWEGHTDGQVTDLHAAQAAFGQAVHDHLESMTAQLEGVKTSVAQLAQHASEMHNAVSEVSAQAGTDAVLPPHPEISLVPPVAKVLQPSATEIEDVIRNGGEKIDLGAGKADKE